MWLRGVWTIKTKWYNLYIKTEKEKPITKDKEECNQTYPSYLMGSTLSWQSQILRAFDKANRAEAIFTWGVGGGKMFQKSAVKEKTLPNPAKWSSVAYGTLSMSCLLDLRDGSI